MVTRQLSAGILIVALLAGCGPEAVSPTAPAPGPSGTLQPIDPVAAADPADPAADEEPATDEEEAPAEDQTPAEDPAPTPSASATPASTVTASPSPQVSALPDLELGNVDSGTTTPATPPKRSFFGKIVDGLKGLVQKVKDRFKRKA